MTQTSAPRDSGFSFKLLVRICGLVGIGAFFLPFFNNVSGLSLVQDIGSGKLSFAGAFTAFSSDEVHTMSKVIGIFFLTGLVVFSIVSIYMLFTAKYAGGPFTLILLFNIAAWILLQFGGEQAGITESLFGHANYGYWVATGALFAPFIGMFFLDKSV